MKFTKNMRSKYYFGPIIIIAFLCTFHAINLLHIIEQYIFMLPLSHNSFSFWIHISQYKCTKCYWTDIINNNIILSLSHNNKYICIFIPYNKCNKLYCMLPLSHDHCYIYIQISYNKCITYYGTENV